MLVFSSVAAAAAAAAVCVIMYSDSLAGGW